MSLSNSTTAHAAHAAPFALAKMNSAESKDKPEFLTDSLPLCFPLDALPYVDALPPDQQQEVQQLLQQEMSALAKENDNEGPPDYLADFQVPKTPLLDDAESMLGKEFQREPIPELDLEKYSSFSRPSGQKASDLKEWEKCLVQCQQLLQHAAVSHVNLELMVAHAAPSWQRHIKNLSQTSERVFLLCHLCILN
ncbi:hypothetical protein Emag_007119 [Eimeria magna]